MKDYQTLWVDSGVKYYLKIYQKYSIAILKTQLKIHFHRKHHWDSLLNTEERKVLTKR